MALETGTTIAELSRLDPLHTDEISVQDDHTRLIKNVLKDQFPGAGGDGFAAPITATETEMNSLVGVTSPIQLQLETIAADAASDSAVNAAAIVVNTDDIVANDADIAVNASGIAVNAGGIADNVIDIASNLASIESIQAKLFPAGTKMPFFQAACPIGWTIDNTATNHMMAISGVGGTVAGTRDPIVVPDHEHTTGDHVLTEAEMPSHNHESGIANHLDNRFGEVTGATLSESIERSNQDDDEFPLSSTEGSDAAHNHGVTSTVTGGDILHAKFIVCTRD